MISLLQSIFKDKTHEYSFESEWATSEGNDTVTEARLFTAGSGGNLFAVASISPGITKTSDYNLKITWEIPFE